ncbi:hypothetical protein BDR03DRAFT_76458 [Suillus americanus]|nr:hypothetical protein BDR03DRAFT_76458 [Suillus americanus]
MNALLGSSSISSSRESDVFNFNYTPNLRCGTRTIFEGGAQRDPPFSTAWRLYTESFFSRCRVESVMLNIPPLTNCTPVVCPINVWMTFPVSTFHNSTAPSELPLAILPSGDNTIACTPLFCPPIPPQTSCPDLK